VVTLICQFFVFVKSREKRKKGRFGDFMVLLCFLVDCAQLSIISDIGRPISLALSQPFREHLAKSLYSPFGSYLVELLRMAEVIVKRIDPQGRVSIPIEWRSGWKSGKVVLIRRGNRIEVTPIEPILPSSLFDSIKISENVDFADPHSLKKALLELREH